MMASVCICCARSIMVVGLNTHFQNSKLECTVANTILCAQHAGDHAAATAPTSTFKAHMGGVAVSPSAYQLAAKAAAITGRM